jgi:acetylornithine deacetylase/succinyl-diaminopimelate desuccinylase-like protein
MSLPPDDAVRDYIDKHSAAFLEELVGWLRIPSISADPAHHGDVRVSAEYLADRLRATGFPIVEILPTDGLPAVYAEWPAAGPAPTVLVYGHHDVQPVDPEELWENAPFEPLRREGPGGPRLLARGAADDKGQVYFHALGVRAHLAATGRDQPAVNLKLLVEGEEESGSPNFPALLRAHRERFAADVVVVSDTAIWDRDTPSTTTAMRGMTMCELTLRGPSGDVHSGSFGGAVRNPLTELVRLLAGLHDEQGRVTLPGFYDDVVPLSARERELFAALPFDEASWLAAARSSAPYGEAGFSTLERVWARPTAELNGIWGGYTGAGGKTIIPSEAHAKLSFRLVANQEPAAIRAAFERWVAARVPAGISYQVDGVEPGVRPCLTPLDHPALAALSRALGRAFQQEVLYTREGGSGPEADLQEVLGAPVIFLGISVPDDGWHAPNEKVEIPLLLRGAEAAAYLWEELADWDPRA